MERGVSHQKVPLQGFFSVPTGSGLGAFCNVEENALEDWGSEKMEAKRIHPIRNVKYLRPQKEWKEIIAIYLYLAGMGAGSFIIGTLIDWLGMRLNPPFIPSIDLFGYTLNLSKVPIFWGPILVAIGAPFLVLDLGIKWRFMYACLNPRTSWVARGFIILSIFIVFGLILLAKSVLPLNGSMQNRASGGFRRSLPLLLPLGPLFTPGFS